MTRTGTNARVAATQLKAILVGMASPAMEAEGAMSSYGTSAKEFRKTVREEGLIQALLDLRAATAGNEEAMSEIFPNVRALMGVLDMLGANVEYNKQIFESLKNSAGSLERAFAEVSGTTQQKLNVAMATFKATLISIGEALKPFVVKNLARLNDMLTRISGKWEGMTEGQRRFKLATLGLTAAMGPLFVITSRLLALVAQGLGPYMAIAAAIALVVTAVVKLTAKHRELTNIQKKSNEIWGQSERSIAKENYQLEKLFEQLQNAEKGTKDWTQAKESINNVYGKYLDQMGIEIEKAEDLTKVLERLKEVRAAEIRIDVGAKF